MRDSIMIFVNQTLLQLVALISTKMVRINAINKIILLAEGELFIKGDSKMKPSVFSLNFLDIKIFEYS